MLPNQASASTSRHALVIGSGMAGLFAARILGDHFKHVTIVERDQLPTSPEFRAGVPQGRHTHGLLLRGLQILESLFPGISGELEDAGAQRVDWIRDLEFQTAFGTLPRFASPYHPLTCSRPLLEWATRRRLSDHPQISLLEQREVIGLLPNAQKTGVAGIRLRERHPEAYLSGKEEEMLADLVVDASGRDSHVLEWLVTLGYEQPEESLIDGGVGYATRYYQRPKEVQATWKILALLTSWPHIRRGGIILPIEGDRWIVTVAGIGDDPPPTDEAGFLAFVEGMATPSLAEAIKQAEPVSPIYGYRRMENRWRHFEHLARWPEGFIAIGDAVCQLNPYYGQGMAVAALTALALDRALKESGGHPDGTRQFQKALAQVFAAPWLMATSEDLRSPFTKGGSASSMTSRLMYWYIDGVKQLIARSPGALRTFVEVSHLLSPSTALFRPGVLLGVLSLSLSRNAPRKA